MTNRENGYGKTTIVVEGFRHGVSPLFAMIAMLLTLILGLGIIPTATADDAGTSSGTSDTSGTSQGDQSQGDQSAPTFTDDITDTQNLLGADLSKVADAIDTTKQQTGVTVRLMYIPSFGTDAKPKQWASQVLEGFEPDPNTVMLAVASNDGNLVVAVSSNSDEWLKRQSTVDALSQAATDPLLKDTPDWAGAATAMMDEIVKQEQTSTSSSNVRIGIVILIAVLVLLVVVIVVATFIHRRNRKHAMQGRGRRRHKAQPYRGEPSSPRRSDRRKTKTKDGKGPRRSAKDDSATEPAVSDVSDDSAVPADASDPADI